MFIPSDHFPATAPSARLSEEAVQSDGQFASLMAADPALSDPAARQGYLRSPDRPEGRDRRDGGTPEWAGIRSGDLSPSNGALADRFVEASPPASGAAVAAVAAGRSTGAPGHGGVQGMQPGGASVLDELPGTMRGRATDTDAALPARSGRLHDLDGVASVTAGERGQPDLRTSGDTGLSDADMAAAETGRSRPDAGFRSGQALLATEAVLGPHPPRPAAASIPSDELRALSPRDGAHDPLASALRPLAEAGGAPFGGQPEAVRAAVFPAGDPVPRTAAARRELAFPRSASDPSAIGMQDAPAPLRPLAGGTELSFGAQALPGLTFLQPAASDLPTHLVPLVSDAIPEATAGPTRTELPGQAAQIAAPPPTPMPPPVQAQLAIAARALADGPVEITLAPAELGRVTLALSTGDGGLMVTVLAERSETLDLLRRNIGQLAEELRALGYGSPGFSFQQGQRAPERPPAESWIDRPTSLDAPDEAGAASHRVQMAGGRLDLRL